MDRQIYYKDRQTDILDRQIDRQIYYKARQIDRQIDRYIDRYIQSDRQIYWQIDVWKERKKEGMNNMNN